MRGRLHSKVKARSSRRTSPPRWTSTEEPGDEPVGPSNARSVGKATRVDVKQNSRGTKAFLRAEQEKTMSWKAAGRLQAEDHTVKLECPPPQKPPRKVARFTVLAGTQCEIKKITDNEWIPHKTAREIGFEKFERYVAEWKCYEFRFQGWLMMVHRSKVIHREDTY